MKAYNFPLDYVLYEMSFPNMILYSAVLPSYSVKKDGKKQGKKQEVIRADDPKNRDRVKKWLEQIK